jgi:hypothetical protein
MQTAWTDRREGGQMVFCRLPSGQMGDRPRASIYVDTRPWTWGSTSGYAGRWVGRQTQSSLHPFLLSYLP